MDSALYIYLFCTIVPKGVRIWSQHIYAVGHVMAHLPMQNSLKSISNTCSTSTFPVILPIALAACLSSSAANTISLVAYSTQRGEEEMRTWLY